MKIKGLRPILLRSSCRLTPLENDDDDKVRFVVSLRVKDRTKAITFRVSPFVRKEIKYNCIVRWWGNKTAAANTPEVKQQKHSVATHVLSEVSFPERFHVHLSVPTHSSIYILFPPFFTVFLFLFFLPPLLPVHYYCFGWLMTTCCVTRSSQFLSGLIVSDSLSFFRWTLRTRLILHLFVFQVLFLLNGPFFFF